MLLRAWANFSDCGFSRRVFLFRQEFFFSQSFRFFPSFCQALAEDRVTTPTKKKKRILARVRVICMSCANWACYYAIPMQEFNEDSVLAYYRGQGKIANSLLRGWKRTEGWELKREQERQAGRDKRKQGGQPGWWEEGQIVYEEVKHGKERRKESLRTLVPPFKEDKSCMRRSSTGKKEGRKACVLWCLRLKNKVQEDRASKEGKVQRTDLATPPRGI